MKIITLLTDFGLQDGYAGIMKGVIWGIAPAVQITDLTHLIPPQNILEGALALSRAVSYFPPGSIHVAVVDPGVGTRRRPVAAQLGDYFFVGPDNGLCTLLLTQVQAQGSPVQFVQLDKQRYWLPGVSSVFHGRDIFAPVAAHLANGVALLELGTPMVDPVLLEIPQPQPLEGGWRGIVLHIDSFGNLATNLERRYLKSMGSNVKVRLGVRVIHGLVNTFGEGQPGDLVALFDSSDRLSVCMVNGSAAKSLQAQVGQLVEVTL